MPSRKEGKGGIFLTARFKKLSDMMRSKKVMSFKSIG